MRCWAKMTYYNKPGRRPEVTPVCDRPEGHTGRHLSEYAYRNELIRAQRREPAREGRKRVRVR